MVCTMCSKMEADIEQGFYENDSWQMTFFGAKSHLSRGNCRISHEVLFLASAPNVTVCI